VPITVLRQKGKRQKPRETRGRFNIGTPISKQPKEVRKRETFGHWELDTVVSGRGQAKLPEGAIQTATTDRGKEFSCYATLETDLQIHILLGNVTATKMGMDYYVSSSLRKRILMMSYQKNSQKH